jgi:hypothetical protein
MSGSILILSYFVGEIENWAFDIANFRGPLPLPPTNRHSPLDAFLSKIVKNRACKGGWAGLRFALFLGKTLKFVAYPPRVETIDLWQLKFE